MGDECPKPSLGRDTFLEYCFAGKRKKGKKNIQETAGGRKEILQKGEGGEAYYFSGGARREEKSFENRDNTTQGFQSREGDKEPIKERKGLKQRRVMGEYHL